MTFVDFTRLATGVVFWALIITSMLYVVGFVTDSKHVPTCFICVALLTSMPLLATKVRRWKPISACHLTFIDLPVCRRQLKPWAERIRAEEKRREAEKMGVA